MPGQFDVDSCRSLRFLLEHVQYVNRLGPPYNVDGSERPADVDAKFTRTGADRIHEFEIRRHATELHDHQLDTDGMTNGYR